MLFALLEEAGTGCSMSQCSTTLPSESTRKISIPAVSWLLYSKYSNTPFALGLAMPLVHWAMPSRYHSIHKNDLARAMVAQSEQAFLTLAPGHRPRGSGGEDARVQGDGAVLRGGPQRRALNRRMPLSEARRFKMLC